MVHFVASTFRAVALLLAASVREPVLPLPSAVNVSVAIAIVSVFRSFTNVNIVPTGYATLPLAGIVKVRGLLSAKG